MLVRCGHTFTPQNWGHSHVETVAGNGDNPVQDKLIESPSYTHNHYRVHTHSDVGRAACTLPTWGLNVSTAEGRQHQSGRSSARTFKGFAPKSPKRKCVRGCTDGCLCMSAVKRSARCLTHVLTQTWVSGVDLGRERIPIMPSDKAPPECDGRSR